jgi:hypothetical protein
MTPAELIAFGVARYGKRWKMPMAQETGWSYWTLHRAAKGTIEISSKLEKAINDLKGKPRKART